MTPVDWFSDDWIVFTTRTFAGAAGVSVSTATHQLARMGQRGALVRITRGVWANVRHPYFTPLCATPYLLGSEQGYVSFLTALHLHGMLSQIPGSFHIATTGQPRIVRSPVGTFEFFQLHPRFMSTGVVWSETHCPYRIATPEKALLDTCYLATRKGRRFHTVPTIELSRSFSRRRLRAFMRAVLPDPRLTQGVQRRVEAIIQSSLG